MTTHAELNREQTADVPNTGASIYDLRNGDLDVVTGGWINLPIYSFPSDGSYPIGKVYKPQVF